MSNVYNIDGSLEPDDLLENMKGKFDKILIVGWDSEDELYSHTSSTMIKKDVLWVIEVIKLSLLNVTRGES